MRLGKLQCGKESARLFHRQLANFGNRFCRDSNGARFGAQTSPAAFRASRVTTESAQKNAHVQLIFLALQPVEESFDALVVVSRIAFQNQAALLGGQLPPSHVGGDAPRARPLLRILEERPIARLGPWFDGSVVERLAGIGDHQIQIEVDGVAETLAPRTRSVRIVEREKPRLGLLMKRAVILAFESLVECQALTGIPRAIRDEFQYGLALALAAAEPHRVHQPRAP